MLRHFLVTTIKLATLVASCLLQSQSATSHSQKSQLDALECTLEELAILELVMKNPLIKQKELVAETGRSISTVKRLCESLQAKGFIRRVDGKRFGKWEVLV